MSEETIKSLQKDVTEMRADIKFILARLAEDNRKILECQDLFDERYLNKREFKSFLHHELKKLREGGYKTASFIRDVVQIAQTIAIVLLATGVI